MNQLPTVYSLDSDTGVHSFTGNDDDDDDDDDDLRRLQSIARYESFHPQALACSSPLPHVGYHDDDGVPRETLVNGGNTRILAGSGASTKTSLLDVGLKKPRRSGRDSPKSSSSLRPGLVTSLGAVAGSDAIALFRTSRPHEPLMILSHASSSSSSSSSSSLTDTMSASSTMSSLAFSPLSSKSPLYLASTRGSGILIWDVSGHSLSPLQGRLSVEHKGGAYPDAPSALVATPVTCLSWLQKGSQLAATTATTACLWDLRAGNTYRPSLRFGVSNNSNSSSSSNSSRNNASLLPSTSMFRQIACSDREEECAILDSSGIVRIFDTRMIDRSSARVWSMGSVHQFEAHTYAGVGLSFLPVAKETEGCWVTWGLDVPNTDAIVKIWTKNTSTSTSTTATTGAAGAGGGVDGDKPSLSNDDYWFMDTSPARPHTRKTSTVAEATSMSYRLAGQCTAQGLACARVCPSPVEDSIVTVALQSKSIDGGPDIVGWSADLWKVTFHTSNTSGDFVESKLDRITSFQSSAETEPGIRAVLGSDPRLFSLRASELAVSSYPEPVHGNGYGLLLCSLTDNGYVMTHALPEALPMDRHSPKDLMPDRGPTMPMLTQRTRLFPSDSDGAMNDAARAWIRPNSTEQLLLPLTSSRRDVSIGSAAVTAVAGNAGMASSSAFPEGTAGMPFDMDIPLQFSAASIGIPGLSAIGKGDSISPTTLPALGSMDEGDAMDPAAIARDASLLMSSIDTNQLPCPRLCGAVFSPGVGGLAAFHNGDVKKMWSWWAQKDQTRSGTVPGYIGEPAVGATQHATIDGVANRESLAAATVSSHPRTMKDLSSMTSAARASQWGEPGESETSSAGFPVLGTNFFDDDSDSTSESGVGHDDEVADASSSARDQKQMYDSYFRGYQRPLVEQAAPDPNEPLEGGRENDFRLVAVPSSGMLSPIVNVSHEFDRISLQNQSRELAQSWKLGDFKVTSGVGNNTVPHDPSRRARFDPYDRDPLVSQSSLSKRALPSYRSLLPSTSEAARPVSEDERGVHGGEYSVRPNMQESMVFLRKLFTHQHDDGGKVSLSKLLSPPDSPMLANRVKPDRKLGSAQDASQVDLKKTSGNERLRLGVYSRVSQPPRDDDGLKAAEDICLYNASVSESYGDSTKAETWRLVAKIVRNCRNRTSNGFDGWGGISGGSLGVALLSKILSFYELLGDVQMLSTLVCVLRSASPDRRIGKRDGFSILPLNQDRRYDRYILRYANLLYGWGLLTTRLEVMKHLSKPLLLDETTTTDLSTGLDAGLAFVFACPRCALETENGYCASCNASSFRCAVCENAVRGLFVTCDSCGHGGHMQHLTEWFASNNVECPTGCGCKCRLDALTRPISNEVGSSGVIRPINGEFVGAF